MDLGQFLYENFCVQMLEKQYNPVNTVVYIIILLLLSFFVVFPFLSRRGIKFDFKFMLALLPYILFGSALRVFEDIGELPRSCSPLEAGFYTGTPGIYIMVFALAIAGLAVSKVAEKRFGLNFHKLFAGIGLLLALPTVLLLFAGFREWFGFAEVLILVAAAVAITYAAVKFFRKDFWQDKLNLLAVASQSIDGITTYVATQFYSCGEQHFVSGFVLESFAPAFILIKIALILVILYYIDKEIKSENLRGFIKVFITILGFATGIRDILTLGAGTCSLGAF